MSNVVGVLNPKGGCGKTTLALHLAQALTADGPTLLVDTDPQGSARDWAEQAGGHSFPVVGVDRPGTLRNTIAQLAPAYDWVIIDGAGTLAELTAHAIASADLVLIPVQPSPLDLWACADLVEQIRQRQALTDGVPAAAFQVTRAKRGTQLAREIRDVVREYDLPLLDGNIHDRMVFAKSLSEGKTALDIEPEGKAAWEIFHLTKQIREAFI